MSQNQGVLLLRRQLADLNKNPVEGFSAGLIDDEDIYRWEVLIIGPPDTYYEGGFFKAHLTFPQEYPQKPPTMKLITEIWHPNIDSKSGDVCISILHDPGEDKFGYERPEERWLPIHTVETILVSVISMLADPNDESPANLDAACTIAESSEVTDKPTETTKDVTVDVTEPDKNGDDKNALKNSETSNTVHKTAMEKADTMQVARILNPITLHFLDGTIEKEYACQRDTMSDVSCAVFSLVLLFIFLSDVCIVPWSANIGYAFLVAEAGLIFTLLLMKAPRWKKVFPVCLQNVVEKGKSCFRRQLALAFILVSLLSAAHIATMLDCGVYTSTRNLTNQPEMVTVHCPYPTYMMKQQVLILLAVSLLVQIPYLIKSFIIVVLVASYCSISLLLPAMYDDYDVLLRLYLGWRGVASSKYNDCVSLIAVSLAVVYISRTADQMFRKLFHYQHELMTMKTKMADLRERNESLVYNILPSHVALHFIGDKRNNDELYSQTYDEVGVMFAACPNFNDFYTESPVNNNGLECIRVLNEILSDYDDLLRDARFTHITKIKTIGSTYMAASGMTSDSVTAKDATSTERWQHINELVEFAMAMKGSIANINSQSFNNFILRIGINHGPIIAGVIGARKPHYDIWGNTVNVSSRMESTGHLNKIQVVGATMEILLEFGYTFQQRGLVKVKGKGDIMTYFLTGRDDGTNLPNQVSPF